MLIVDTKDLDELGKDLLAFRRKAAPFAIREMLNSQAFAARKLWRTKMMATFVLRNKWTLGSIRVQKVRGGLIVSSMESEVGSGLDYLEEQEDGTTKRAQGKHGVSIPTAYSAGQAVGSYPRRRMVRGPHKMSAIRIQDRATHRKRSIRNIIAVRRAQKSGQKFAFLEFNESKGIFKVLGGRKRPRLRKVWDISRGSVTVPPHPTLGPTAERVRRNSGRFFRIAVVHQLRRAGIFGY